VRPLLQPDGVRAATATPVGPACYRTTQLFSGDSTFVLSYSGHIASLVNPPGNPKSHYWEGGEPGPDPESWLNAATKKAGSWWEPWADWVSERADERTAASARSGSSEHPVLGEAPGLYVPDLVPL